MQPKPDADGIIMLKTTLLPSNSSFVENYQVIDTSATSKTDAIEYFESLANDIKENKFKAIKEEDTHLHSLLDDIVCLIYKTLYKLKYNK